MGPQWWGMGRQLLEEEPVFRDAVVACDRAMREFADWSLVEEMTADESVSRMSETWLAQPANFAVQVGLAALWRSHGVRPDAVVGHSTGEIAAFHEAGVYTLRDAARIAVHRSRLQQTLAGTGGMLAVSLSEEEAERRVRPYADRVSVAAVNSPTAITLAGDEAALALLAEELRAEQQFAKFLTVEVPYHSVAMERVKDELLRELAPLEPRPARIPLYLTGVEGTARGEELDAAYWWKNVRDRVRFRSAVDRLAADGHRLFLEIGPHPVLGHAIRESLDAAATPGLTLPSIRRRENESERFATSLGSLHTLGVPVDWDLLHPAGRPVTLPRHPFRRDRHWTEPGPVAQVRLGRRDHPLLGRRTDATAPPGWPAWTPRTCRTSRTTASRTPWSSPPPAIWRWPPRPSCGSPAAPRPSSPTSTCARRSSCPTARTARSRCRSPRRTPRSPSPPRPARTANEWCTRPESSAPDSAAAPPVRWTPRRSGPGPPATSRGPTATPRSPPSATTTAPPSRPSTRSGSATAKSSPASARPGRSTVARPATTSTPSSSTPASRPSSPR